MNFGRLQSTLMSAFPNDLGEMATERPDSGIRIIVFHRRIR